MIEIHPFGCFVPPKARYLILGSFTTKEAFNEKLKAKYVWFYANGGRNAFWPILSEIYSRELKTRKQMEQLLTEKQIALGDIIYKCERRKVSNLDIHLVNIVYATREVTEVLRENKIEKIFFTSRFVETKFKQAFKEVIEKYPEIKLITLPSPSPRYVGITMDEKIMKYEDVLPK